MFAFGVVFTCFVYFNCDDGDVVVSVSDMSVVFNFWSRWKDTVFDYVMVSCGETVVVDPPEFRA